VAKVTPIQENFNAGEFGARMAARVTFDKYQNAGSICENILPLPQGGFTRRAGFRYIADAVSPADAPWLIPFVFSTLQAYILELGASTVRFFKDQGQISAAATDAVIVNGTFDADITSWTDRSTGTGTAVFSALHGGSLALTSSGLSDLARAYQAVTVSTGLNAEHVLSFEVNGSVGVPFKVRVGSSLGGSEYYDSAVDRTVGQHTIQFTPTASPFYVEFEQENLGAKVIYVDDVKLLNDEPVALSTPWGSDVAPLISYAQSADVLYLCAGEAVRPYRLDRYGHSSWALSPPLFDDGPWLAQNFTTTTLLASATTGNNVTLTASSVVGINKGAGFRTTDVGRLVRSLVAGTPDAWSWAQITGYTSTTVVTVDILGTNPFPAGAVDEWRLGEWNDTDGWPAVVGFIQQRLGFAASPPEPQKFWLSKSADTVNFQDEDLTGVVQDDSSISYRFAALQVNTIRWLASRKRPVVGTQGGNWTLNSDGAVLTPSDISADFEVTGGVARLPPIEVRARLLFAQTQGRKLLEFADVLTTRGAAGYDSFDLTLLNDRILTSGIRQMGFAQEPDSVVWVVREDGQVPTLTYQPEQTVVGWARQIHGGSFAGGNAVVESVAVIPGQNGSGQFKNSIDRFEVWVSVKLTINGSTVRYIECLEGAYTGDEDLQQDAFYVDSGLTLDNPVTITGITQADPGVVTTATVHGFVNADFVRIVRVVGMSEVDGVTFKVANVTSNTFELTDWDDVAVDTSGYGAYAAGGEVRKTVTALSGLGHLEGETVKVFADGAVQVDQVVASGAITLEEAASVVHVGLAYPWTWKSLKLAYGAELGTAVGQPKNISDITLVLLETADGSITASTVDSDGVNVSSALDLRKADAVDGDAVPLYTGEQLLGLVAGYDQDLRLLLTGSEPSPCTVLAVMVELETEE
jgi:hypothetical protein